jgi:hypothetical protein
VGKLRPQGTATGPHIPQEVKPHTSVRLSIVHCPPVTTAIIRRPHAREQLGFCVEDGIVSAGAGAGAGGGGRGRAAATSMALSSLLTSPDLQPPARGHR